jgi:hypothetical protein
MDPDTQEKIRATRVMLLLEAGLLLAIIVAAFTIIFEVVL